MTDDTLMTVTVKRSPGGLMALLKAKSIARYKLHTVPGRPEELVENLGAINPIMERPEPGKPLPVINWDDPAHRLPPKTISFGYIHGSVRVRQHGGERNREWVDSRDVTFRDGWLTSVWEYLDPFFGYNEPTQLTFVMNTPPPHVELQLDPSKIIDLTRPRPIRDNPQA